MLKEEQEEYIEWDDVMWDAKNTDGLRMKKIGICFKVELFKCWEKIFILRREKLFILFLLIKNRLDLEACILSGRRALLNIKQAINMNSDPFAKL